MPIVKKCRHGRGKTDRGRRSAWRACGCQWYADLRVNGVRAYLPLGADEGAARVAYAQAVLDRETGALKVAGPAGHGVETVARAWLASLAAEKPPPRPATLNAYRSRVNVIAAWYGDGDIRAVTGDEVAAFEKAIGVRYAANYARDVRTTFGNVMRYAVSRGIIPAVPLSTERRRKRNGAKPDRLSIEDAEAVIAALRSPLREMAEVALLTGLRRGELLGLRAQDFDDAGRVLRLREQVTEHGRGPLKTETSHRVVGLSPRAVEILRERVKGRDPRDPIFPVGYWVAGDSLRRTMTRLGVYRPGRGWHSFRHGNAALRERAGQSLRDAAASMGHGARYAQTLAYGWSAEVADASRIDDARHGQAPESSGAAGAAETD